MKRYFYERDDRGFITATHVVSVLEGIYCYGYAKVNPKEQGAKAEGREHVDNRARVALGTLLATKADYVTIEKIYPNQISRITALAHTRRDTFVDMLSGINYPIFMQVVHYVGD